jgi:xanthine dehydrogenase accessory factor
MSNQINHWLERWYPKRDELEWVLGTIVHTEGSSYRSEGAMMLINSLGQYDGMLSGGCLESDIMRRAKKVMAKNRADIVEYDMLNEDDIGWKLGLGCGGIVHILLQPLHAENNYQGLAGLYELLQNNQSGIVLVDTEGQQNNQLFTDMAGANEYIQQHINSDLYLDDTKAIQLVDDHYLLMILRAAPHIAIFGGGVDARPLVKLASILGWHIDLIDHRTGYARPEYFPQADVIHKEPFQDLADKEFLAQIDAAIIMGHNVGFDASAIKLLQYSPVKYIGLLGPEHRKQEVLDEASLQQLRNPITGPIGLNIGGELPESIALSVLAEIHAYLNQADGLSITGVLGKAKSAKRGEGK